MLRAYAGGTVFAEQTGTSTPEVVALHGWRRTHSDFDQVLSGLNALAVDLPGFGASPPPDRAWGAQQYADALVPLLSELSPPVVLLGHSLGGRIATVLAARHPHLVRGVVLTGAPLLRPQGSRTRLSLRFRIARRLHRLRLLSDKRIDRLRQQHGSDDYRAAQGVMRDTLVRLVNESYDNELVAITCPVELVWGEADTAAPLEMARRIEALLPHARLTVCPGAGHMTPHEVPAELRAALDRLLLENR